MNREAISQLQIQLQEDVEAFASLLRPSVPLPPHHVRIVTSSILRKWFVDSLITKLGNALGCTFSFPALDNSSVVEKIKRLKQVQFFFTGGVRLGGTASQGIYVSDEPAEKSPVIPVHEMKYVDLKYSSFIEQPRIYHEGRFFKTRDIIVHMSNKLGGVHFDPRRKSDAELSLDLAASYFSLGNPTFESEPELIEDERGIFIVLPQERGYTWNCLDVEMLAAAQSFMNLKINGETFLVFNKA